VDSITTIDGITDGSGNPISLEQYAAQRAGYTVTVVTGTEWGAMTATDFAKYQLLIAGDPGLLGHAGIGHRQRRDLGTGRHGHLRPRTRPLATVPWSAPTRSTTTSAAVCPPRPATRRPRVPSTSSRTASLMPVGFSGATGSYFDTTCADNGGDLSVLNSLSAAGTGFTENTSPPCGGSVQLVAANPVFASLTDSDIQGWNLLGPP